MKTITIGSFKGGTGKTTLAAVLGTYFASRGLHTRLIELETGTRPLARFCAMREFADLPTPETIELSLSGGTPDLKDWQAAICQEKQYALQQGADVLIIDTTSVWKHEVVAAHLEADLILTTVTESPIDLYQFMSGMGPTMQATKPYANLIQLVQRHAAQKRQEDCKWLFCLNRRSHLKTRIGDQVSDQLEDFTHETGTRMLPGLVDRVSYRNMMAIGATPIDEIAGVSMKGSLLSARTESNMLSAAIADEVGVRRSASGKNVPNLAAIA